MVVGDEVVGLALLLKADGREHGSEIIAQVQGAARLDASENAHGSEVAEAPPQKAKGKMPETPRIAAKRRKPWREDPRPDQSSAGGAGGLQTPGRFRQGGGHISRKASQLRTIPCPHPGFTAPETRSESAMS